MPKSANSRSGKRSWLFPAVLALAAPIGGMDEVHAQEIMELRRGLHAEPDTLDPHQATLKTSWYVLGDLYEGLTRADVAGRPAPGAAHSWNVSEDGLTWTFFLRPDLKWSDGAPLTAEDFEAGFRRLFDPAVASKNAVFLDMIVNADEIVRGTLPEDALGVRAVDAHTLQIELEHPVPQLAVLLSAAFASPLPRHAVRAGGIDSFRTGGTVTNGAYRLREWNLNSSIELTRNENYWDAEQVAIDRVIYFPITSESAALNRFRSGGLDIVSWFGLPQHQWLERNSPEAIHTPPALFVTYLVFNSSVTPFDDARLRKALSLAIDRRIITDNILRIDDEPTFHFVPAGVSNYDSLPRREEELTAAERHTEALALMAQAGHGPRAPLNFEFRVRNGDDERRTALAIADMWQEIGAIAEITITDLAAHYADLEEANFSVADAGWSVFDAPELFLDLMRSETGAFNYGNYSNSAFDALLDRALSMPDIEQRHQLMAEAQSLMLDDQPVAPLYFNVSRYIVSPRISGFVDNPADIHLSRSMAIDD